jgi:hypothetical protein
LYLLGLPVARDMQGEVLTSVIDKQLLYKRNLKYINTYEKDRKGMAGKIVRSPEEEKIIKDRMRSLGNIN